MHTAARLAAIIPIRLVIETSEAGGAGASPAFKLDSLAKDTSFVFDSRSNAPGARKEIRYEIDQAIVHVWSLGGQGELNGEAINDRITLQKEEDSTCFEEF
jgi:hypothetical protein